MSLKSRRRIMLKRCQNEPGINETIISTDLEPNGDSFSFVSKWDPNSDTLYVEWVDEKVNILGNFISIAGINNPSEVSCISNWQDYQQLHCYDNTDGNYYGHDKELMLCFLPDVGLDQRLYIMLNNGLNKLLINSNGLYINGLKKDRNGNNIFKSLEQKPYIVVGSTEGTNRSFDIYNKISIIHEKYTEEQMEQLTITD